MQWQLHDVQLVTRRTLSYTACLWEHGICGPGLAGALEGPMGFVELLDHIPAIARSSLRYVYLPKPC